MERNWRSAIIKSDISQMSRLLKENPELVNWQVRQKWPHFIKFYLHFTTECFIF